MKFASQQFIKAHVTKKRVCTLKMCSLPTPHAIVLCPVNLDSAKRFASNVGVVFSIGSKIQRSVALVTTIFTAHNQEAKLIPTVDRNVAILCDSGAQRSLITRECIDRLGLQVVRTERACLQGYG